MYCDQLNDINMCHVRGGVIFDSNSPHTIFASPLTLFWLGLFKGLINYQNICCVGHSHSLGNKTPPMNSVPSLSLVRDQRDWLYMCSTNIPVKKRTCIPQTMYSTNIQGKKRQDRQDKLWPTNT